MNRFFVSNDAISETNINITGDDVNHISKVLRLRIGDKVIVCDGEKYEYTCNVSSIAKKSVILDILQKSEGESESPVKVHLYQGIPKASKMDTIIQKCTELGVDSITPIDTERVVAKLGQDRDISNKMVRWQRISEEASKQSGRIRIPDILDPIKYKDALEKTKDYDIAIIPYEKEEIKGLKHVLYNIRGIKSAAIFIGPEGGFTEDEIAAAKERGIIPVTLGPRILRTETAGFVCLSIIMYELGDLGGNE